MAPAVATALLTAVALSAHCAAAALFDPQQCGSKLDGSNHGPIRWLADTGCPADLIGLNDMTAGDIERIEQTKDPYVSAPRTDQSGRTPHFLYRASP